VSGRHTGGTFRRHWPIFLLLLVVVIAAWGAATLPPGSRLKKAAWGALVALPTAVSITQYAYIRFERLRLAVHRMVFTITNPSMKWALRAQFDVADPDAAWTRLEEKLHTMMVEGDRRLAGERPDVAWQWRDLPLLTKLESSWEPLTEDGDVEPDHGRHLLVAELPVVQRPFRDWRRTITHDIVPLLSGIDDALRPAARKFQITLHFPAANPYFGLFVSQVGRDSVIHFDIHLLRREAGEVEAVTVHADRLELVTSSVVAAERLSLHYLALAGMPGLGAR
jgi:hypothetical protein